MEEHDFISLQHLSLYLLTVPRIMLVQCITSVAIMRVVPQIEYILVSVTQNHIIDSES